MYKTELGMEDGWWWWWVNIRFGVHGDSAVVSAVDLQKGVPSVLTEHQKGDRAEENYIVATAYNVLKKKSHLRLLETQTNIQSSTDPLQTPSGLQGKIVLSYISA